VYQLLHKIRELYPKSRKLYDKYKDQEYIYFIPLALLSLSVRLRYFFYLLTSGTGFPQSDDSQWYLDYARALMADFKIGLHMNDVFYLGYNILLTVLLAIFKDPVAVIFIQALVAGISVILVYKIAHMLFNRTTAILASYFYSYYSWGITLWSMYILSDSFFISLLLLNVYLLLKFMETHQKKYRILFIVTALYMIIFRPTGIISLGFIMIYILINLPRKTVFGFLKKYRLAIGGFVAVCAAAFTFLYMGGSLNPLIESMQFNAKKVLYNIYANGWIFDKPSAHDHYFRPDYNINILNSLILSFIINNWDHISIIYGKRIIAFLGRWAWETKLDSKHAMLRLAENLVPTLLFLIGTIAAIANGLFRKSSIIWLNLLTAFVFCIVFFIDALYRYKAPGIPFIAIAVAYGADRIIHGAISIAKKYAGKLLWNKENYKEKY
jgi:4-amino-4-deoxy-L-arabinose transferase-like glycosyltransferase